MRGGPTSRMGFTLIEVIITLVLFGIMATMLGPYLVRSVSQSSTPLTNLKKEMSLQTSMEKLVESYESSTNDLNALKSLVTTSATGNYKVVTNEFCKLNASNVFEVDSTQINFLMVTIQSLTTSEQLTIVFSKRS